MDNWVKIRLLEVADANRAVAVQPEDFVEGEDDAGAAAMIAPPMMDILPWSTSPRRMAKPP